MFALSGHARQHSAAVRMVRMLFLLALVSALMLAAFDSRATVPTTPTGWNLVFSDDFTGPANAGVNTANWRYTTGTSYPGGPGGFGTGEIETMTASTANVFLDGAGNLNIKAIRNGNAWTSGRIETNREDFQPPAGGVLRVEARIQLPNLTGAAAQGYWPAFWMLGTPYRGNYWNWPSIGEFDIMENVQGINQVWGTMHCGTSPGGQCNEKNGIGGNRGGFSPSLQADFHTYAIEWDRSMSPQQVRWYIDGIQYHQVSQSQMDAGTWAAATNHSFFIILNNSIGGEFPAALGGGPYAGTASGGTLKVDYVAVWSRGTGGGGGGGAAVPGKVEAEFYSAMSGIQTEPTTDVGGGLDVGWIEAGDWMDYNVNVATTGTYTVEYRVAALTSPGWIQLQRNGATLATTAVPVTGGWQNWTTVTATVNLTAGAQTLRLFAGATGFNVNWINFILTGGGGAVAAPTFAPAGGSYSSAQSVSIATATAGATIRYTTDGSTPAATSTQYTGPINVATTRTIKAIAIKAGLPNSAVASATYTIGGVPPGDYSSEIVKIDATTIEFRFTSNSNAAWVDVHYLVDGANQQNFRMAKGGNLHTKSVTGLSPGKVITYWFTYEKAGLATDTPRQTFTM